jgi:hypothetical protein
MAKLTKEDVLQKAEALKSWDKRTQDDERLAGMAC